MLICAVTDLDVNGDRVTHIRNKHGAAGEGPCLVMSSQVYYDIHSCGRTSSALADSVWREELSVGSPLCSSMSP